MNVGLFYEAKLSYPLSNFELDLKLIIGTVDIFLINSFNNK
jgi:hypothetical protein